MAPPPPQKRSLSPQAPGLSKKQKHEYSDNANTRRELARRANMSEAKAAEDKARRATNQRRQRAVARAKKLPGYQQLSLEEQEREITREFQEGELKYQATYARKQSGRRTATPRRRITDPVERKSWLAASSEAWKAYRKHWKSTILVTSRKLTLLDNVCHDGNNNGVFTPSGKGTVMILVSMGLPLISRHSGTRPEVRSAFNFCRPIFQRYSQKHSPKSEWRATAGHMNKRRPVIRFQHRIKEMKQEARVWKQKTDMQRTSWFLQRLWGADEVAQALGAYDRGTFGPHHLFTEAERAVFRNLAAHHDGFYDRKDGPNQITLPGPQWLWPTNYDFNKHGMLPERDVSAALAMYEMIKYGKDEEVPDRFLDVLKSGSEFRMMGLSEDYIIEEDNLGGLLPDIGARLGASVLNEEDFGVEYYDDDGRQLNDIEHWDDAD